MVGPNGPHIGGWQVKGNKVSGALFGKSGRFLGSRKIIAKNGF